MKRIIIKNVWIFFLTVSILSFVLIKLLSIKPIEEGTTIYYLGHLIPLYSFTLIVSIFIARVVDRKEFVPILRFIWVAGYIIISFAILGASMRFLLPAETFEFLGIKELYDTLFNHVLLTTGLSLIFLSALIFKIKYFSDTKNKSNKDQSGGGGIT